jgi:hypothetical protein
MIEAERPSRYCRRREAILTEVVSHPDRDSNVIMLEVERPSSSGAIMKQVARP